MKKISKSDQVLQNLITEKGILFSFFSMVLTIIFSHLMTKDNTFPISQFIWFLASIGTLTLSLVPLIAAKHEIKVLKRPQQRLLK